jgi:ribose 5-phosphate isomerase A
MSVDDQKRAVGEVAADLVQSGMIVGLGTGSTAVWLVRALADRQLDIRCVSTSLATATLASELGLLLADLDDVPEIDLTIDGADEIGPDMALIKGAGAAMLREKLVWEASRRCVCIADASKVVKILGAGAYPLPIEVIPFGHTTTLRRIRDGLADCGILTAPSLRQKDGAVVITDSGNLIYDAHCGAILDPVSVEAALKSITGVVEHGLFLGLTKEALIGTDRGVERLGPRDFKETPNG